MTRLGMNLEEIFKKCNNYFKLTTVLGIGIQLVKIIRDFHSIGYLHRDLKPQNMCIGPESNGSKIYLIDFGVSKSYLTQDGKHIPGPDHVGITGTLRYMSLNSHKKLTLSRRDDLN